MKQLAIRIIFLFFYCALKFIPARIQEAAAIRIGDLVYNSSSSRKSAMRANLRIAFGTSMTDEQLDTIARDSYRNMIMSAFEFIRFTSYTRDDIVRMVEVVGEENMRAASDRGKGVVVISAHFGNWELLAARIHTLGYSMTAVGRGQEDSMINDFIVKLRTGKGTKNIPRGAPMFEHITGLLDANELVGLVSDQNAGPRGLFIDFFGAPAATFKGPGMFGVMKGSALVPVFIVRRGYQKHTAYLCQPVEIQPTGDAGKDVVAYTQAFSLVIEDFVRRHPDHWFWVHKRWKTTPPGFTGDEWSQRLEERRSEPAAVNS